MLEMRLDKFLSEVGVGTRSQVKAAVRKGRVTVNGDVVTRPEYKVKPGTDTVAYAGTVCAYERVYYMLHKPAGVVTAVTDNVNRTVMDLIDTKGRKKLSPVGRLDKDTEGLLLITDDGALSHSLLSPARHVDKTYLARLAHPLTPESKRRLETGVDIGDGKPTLPASIQDVSNDESGPAVYITIREGRFHQIKRMLEAVENEVVYLKRLSMGSLRLDEALPPGEYRRLTDEELSQLRACVRRNEDSYVTA